MIEELIIIGLTIILILYVSHLWKINQYRHAKKIRQFRESNPDLINYLESKNYKTKENNK